MLGKKVLNQLNAYQQGKQTSEVQKEFNLEKIVKLSSNENPYGYSPKVKDAFTDFSLNLEVYPDGYGYDIKMKIADKLAVNEKQLVIGAGSDEIISFISRVFLYPGVNTVMATPTFTQYRQNALIEGAELKEIPTVSGRHDLVSMLEAIDQNTKVVWLCTPDNPTGELIKAAEFEAFMEKCPKEVIVVLDEAYYEYVAEDNRMHLLDNLSRYANLIVLRTLSKAYGLAGLRVGYGVTNELIAEKLNIIRGPFNTTSLSQSVAVAALDDQEFIEKVKKLNDVVKSEFELFLDSINWHYFDSHTNFILVKTPIDADEAALYLLKAGFIIRSGTFLGYPNTIRITIGNKTDMKQLQHVILKLHEQIIEEVNK